MNSYKTTCTHQQIIASRKAAADTIKKMAAKTNSFWVADCTKSRKGMLIKGINMGIYDAWIWRTTGEGFEIVPKHSRPCLDNIGYTNDWTEI